MYKKFQTKIFAIALSCILVICSGCSHGYDLLGRDVFGLPENEPTSYTIRHAGMSIKYYSYERPAEAARYKSLLNSMMMNKTNKKGSLDANLYEISTLYVKDIMDGTMVGAIEPIDIKVIVNGNMVLYNDQWYEADTSRLLRQLEKDFS